MGKRPWRVGQAWPLLVLLCAVAACARDNAVPAPVRPAATTGRAAPAPLSPAPGAPAVATFTPIPPLPPTAWPTPAPPTASPRPTGTPAPWRVSADPGAPAEVVAAARALAAHAPARFVWVDDAVGDIHVAVGEGRPLATWVHAVAAPFPTVRDGVTNEELRAAWRGAATDLGALRLDAAVAGALAPSLGAPGGAIVAGEEDWVAGLWTARPAWTIVPFDQLEPRLKVLSVAGRTPLAPDYSPVGDPLAVTVGVVGEATAVAAFQAAWSGPSTNRDPARLTRLAMTGPSGLSRAVADRMERYGVAYPGRFVAPLLRSVDIAHLSNEIPFAPDCPPSERQSTGDTIFCARDAYLALMTDLGVDINEMTGNHVNDWGEPNLQHTLDLYETAGIAVFGGGRDLAAAEAPLLWTHNGNRLAFVGCNSEGPPRAYAREDYGGARPCGDFAAIADQIRGLRDEGYLVIATLQYLEHYMYEVYGAQRRDFRALAGAGATAVSGSQGHHAQGFDFHAGAFIHYGLGNLFFDQMDLLGTRQSSIDVYVIYDNRLLSVDVWTGLIEDYCCPRPMTGEERAAFLATMFAGSGW